MKGRWQHWINFLAGTWLFVSPWLLDYLDDPFIAAVNAVLVGAAILLCSLLALHLDEVEGTPKATFILGAWTTLAPWAFEFTDPTRVAANALGVGFLVLLMSAWMLAEDESQISWGNPRRYV